jgi:hypothetical protein
MIRSVFMPTSLPVQVKQVHRQASSVVMPRTGQTIQQAIGKTVVSPLLMLGMVFSGVTQWVKSAVAQTAVSEVSHAPSMVDKYAQRVLANLLVCSEQGKLWVVSNVPPPPSMFASPLINTNRPVMAVLAQYNSEKFCNISKNYLQNIANLGGFPVEKPNQLSIPLNLEGTKRAFIPYVTENSEIQFKINDSLVKGK